MAFDNHGLGYRALDESPAFLRATQAPFAYSAHEAAQAPDEIDHRGWLQVENQVSTNACIGHGDSSALEVCNHYETGGEVIQLSRWYAYITAQSVNGWVGTDGGASLAGAISANGTRGICLAATCPFTGKYYTKLPAAADAEASQHKLLRHTIPHTYDDAFAWLQTGQGAVIIGVRWWRSFRENTGIMDTFAGKDRGFHCLAIVGYSKRTDKRGRKYFWLVNSWGPEWGAHGWAEVAPAVFDQWCLRRDNEEIVMVSDLQDYGAREVIVDIF